MLNAIRKALGFQCPRLGPIGFRLFSKLCPARIDTEIVPGIRTTLDLTDNIQRVIYWQGRRYEKETLDRLTAHLAEAEAFFDVGANLGFVSYSMLSRCPKLNVYAFEPNPTLYRGMVETRERNRLARFHPFQTGIGAANGIMQLHVSTANSGHSTFGRHPGFSDANAHSVRVPLTPFDEWRRETGITPSRRCGWVMKVDVEGYELHVLQGMADSLAAGYFKCICMEVNRFTQSFCGHAAGEILDHMSAFGYAAFDDKGAALSADSVGANQNVFFLAGPKADDAAPPR